MTTGEPMAQSRKNGKADDDNVTPLNADDVAPEVQALEKLGEFEGMDVVQLALVVKKTGDGLNKAIEVEPKIIGLGDVVTMVLQGPVTGVKFKEIKDMGVAERIVEVTTAAVAIVPESDVQEALDNTQKLIDERAGVKRLPFGAKDSGAPDKEGD